MSLLSNLSYTNKDFNSIYNELLDLVSKISPAWDPGSSINGSNESDPGVILLKLDALLADKNNYNIDKNVLELFPDSVTQYPNARELYEQCGYVMRYYQASETYITLSVKGTSHLTEEDKDKLDNNKYVAKYTFDPFLQVTAEDGKKKFVIVDPDISIYSDISTADFRALQGTRNTYRINGNNIITLSDLDYNNRVYFKETNIAENGIFIHSIDDNNVVNYHSTENWKKVDNLLTEAQNTRCYKFGVSRDASQCYVEFPLDIANLIGRGIQIDYILTDGVKGNTNRNTLKKFAEDAPVITVTINGESLTEYTGTTSSTPEEHQVQFIINNYQDSYDGADPETLEDARKNYERTKNTFETLVSLGDYNNFVLNSKRVSNGFVCDRTDDVQSSTKIITSNGDLTDTFTQVATRGVTETPEMTAFDLRYYLLKDSQNKTPAEFDVGFNLVGSTSMTVHNLKEDLKDIKSIQHDFVNLTANDIVNIQLRYPINVRVFPFNKIDAKAQIEIQENIVRALLKTLNSKNMKYGKEVEYDLVYDTIINSDNRIKAIVLDDISYTPFVAYLDTSDNTTYIPLKQTTGDTAKNFRNLIQAKSVLCGATNLYDLADDFNYSVLQTPYINSADKITKSYVSDVGKVSTETKLTLTKQEEEDGTTSASITLKENENIYLTAPNYITKDTYSTYVKYFHNLSSQVSKDSIHELASGEYIIFFWKTSDDDPCYQYDLYKGGVTDGKQNIISPSFQLSEGIFATDKVSARTGSIAEAFNSAEGIIEGIVDKATEGVLTHGTLDDTGSKIIAKCDRDVILSGTKQINIKGQNNITFLHNQHKLYWVLNKSVYESDGKEYYKLEFNSNEYTLKSGEYLFYAPFDDSYFALLGAGTKLKIDKVNSSISTSISSYLQVEARSYEEILYGKDSLLGSEGLWCFLGNNIKIEATEMQFYSFGKDTELKFENLTDNIVINSTSITNLSSDTTIKYKLSSDTEYSELPSINVSNGGWSGYSLLNLKCQPSESQILVYEEDSGKYKREQAIIVHSKFSDGKFSSIQKEDQPKIAPSIDTSRISIQSTYSLDILGGSDVDVTAVNILGERFANSFYCYTERTPVNTKELVIKNRLNVILNEKVTAVSVAVPEREEKERILLPIQTVRDYTHCYISNVEPIATTLSKGTDTDIPTTQVTYLFVGDKSVSCTSGSINKLGETSLFSGDTLAPGMYELGANKTYKFQTSTPGTKIYTTTSVLTPFNKSSRNLASLGEYYFKFTSSDFSNNTGTLYIFLSEADIATTSSMYIHPCVKYKYTDSDPLETSATNELLAKMFALDTNEKFKYTYVVSPDDLIANPLEGKSFLYENHPYNHCTICKWDHTNSSIQIVNKSR